MLIQGKTPKQREQSSMEGAETKAAAVKVQYWPTIGQGCVYSMMTKISLPQGRLHFQENKITLKYGKICSKAAVACCLCPQLCLRVRAGEGQDTFPSGFTSSFLPLSC